MDIYIAIDEDRIASEDVAALLSAMGATGFGRDASIGLGKFEVMETAPLPPAVASAAWWTLAPCAPQGLGFDRTTSFYKVLTRFGRHGNMLALAGQPFKTPVLLAATGAVFTSGGAETVRVYIGQGIGGHGLLSKADPGTVQQGYAPVLPLAM